MPGFLISDHKWDSELRDCFPERCILQELKSDRFFIKRNTLNKFMEDKAFYAGENTIVVLEGYLLNKKDLFQKYHVTSVEALVEEMYCRIGETFFSEFRGSFSGAFYDRKKDQWLVFTNQTGDQPVFYSITEGLPDARGSKKRGFLAASEVKYLLDLRKRHAMPLSIEEHAIYEMLTFGFMEGASTYAKEIKRLRGGTYLCIEKGNLTVKEYHHFYQHPKRLKGKTIQDLVELVDQMFLNAVRMEYEKDEEYHYQHLTDLSGGLDSRMNAWAAHVLAPRHLQLLTYCKANYLDELIAKEIASFWKDEILIKPLDDASFMYDVDQIVSMNGGLGLYSGITGGNRLLQSLHMESFGLEHTGQLGDVILGSYYRNQMDIKNEQPSGMYSERLRQRLKKSCKKEYRSHEEYLIYTRGFQGILSTHMIRKNYTEVCSPFLDVDFLQLCMDIPAEYRIGHRLYKQWIKNKYPQAAEYIWEKTGCKITVTPAGYLIRKLPEFTGLAIAKALRAAGVDIISKNGMNPVDYWIRRNQNLRKYMAGYVREGMLFLQGKVPAQLIKDMKFLFFKGNFSEKSMVMTVLAAVKQYFRG